MIEETLERIAVAIERVADLMDRTAAEELSDDLVNQIVPDTLGGLTPGSVGQVFTPPTGPTHHTGTFIAPPPPDADTMPGPGDPAELDTAKHRWDARIHSTARTKVKNTGEWKLLRGVDKNLVAAVFAEQAGAAPAVSPAPGPVLNGPPPMTIADFVVKVTSAGYTMETMQPFLTAHGITALPLLVKQPELIPIIAGEMGVL
jgi:hypothetical protein